MGSALRLVAFSLVASGLFAQFGDVRVTLDVQRLKERDRRITSGIPRQVDLFFTTTPWGEEYGDLEIILTIQMIFEAVSDKGGERVYSIQCLFSNGSDQRYFAKAIQFPYSAGQGITYSPVIFEPLASAMEYYGFVVLAGEADTYEPLGGTRFYERTRELALRGVASQYRRGWSDRIELVDQLSKNKGLRLAKFYFYEAQAFLQEGDFKMAGESYTKMIDNLDLALERLPREHYTMIFLGAHAQELSQLPAALINRDRILKALIRMDPDNAKIYERGLDIKSE